MIICYIAVLNAPLSFGKSSNFTFTFRDSVNVKGSDRACRVLAPRARCFPGALPPVPVASSSPIPLQPPAPGPQLPGKEGNGEGEVVVGNATKENEEKNSSFEARNNEMLKVLKECKDQLST